MKVVVADTSPINYLVLIDKVDVLRRLYIRIVIPEEVLNELGARGAPPQVSAWIRAVPEWVEVRSAMATPPLELQVGKDDLDAGEIAALSVALGAKDSLLLIDESAGRMVASRLGIANTGTLGILLAAARAGMVDFGEALTKLRLTNFRVSPALIERLLAEKRAEGATRGTLSEPDPPLPFSESK